MELKRALAAIFVLAIVASPLVVVSGPAKADGISTLPSFQGGFIADHGQVLAFVGTLSWGGQYVPVNNGSQVYAGTLVLVLYDLVDYNITTVITLTELGNSHPQQSTLQPGVADVVNVGLQNENSWTNVKLDIGGTSAYYQVAVPLSLLPSGITTVGGVDILVLGVISECLIALACAVAFAYWIMRRALWAPKFSLLIWGHVILVGIASVILVDFQVIDQVFAGWSPLVYAAFLFPVFWAFSLSYFNSAPKAELLRANAPLAGRLSYDRWTIRTARDPKGRLVLVDPTWRGFWARVWGHHVELQDAEAKVTNPEPFVADLVNRRVISREGLLQRVIGSRHSVARRVRRPSPGKAWPTDDFTVIPATVDGRPMKGDEPPVKLYWTPVGQPVDVDWPRLSIHRDVLVPAKVNAEGLVLVPEHYTRRLSLPHYTEGTATLVLHSIHYRSAQSVVAGWRSVEDLAQVLATTTLDNETMKAAFETEVTRRVRERLLAHSDLLGRGLNDLDKDEATLEAERTKNDLLTAQEAHGKKLVDDADEVPKKPAGRKRGK